MLLKNRNILILCLFIFKFYLTKNRYKKQLKSNNMKKIFVNLTK